MAHAPKATSEAEVLHPAEVADRERRAAVGVARAAFFILITTIALLTVLNRDKASAAEGGKDVWWLPVAGALILFVLSVGVDAMLPRKRIATISGVVFGAIAGVLATVAASAIIDLLAQTWLPPASLATWAIYIATLKVLIGISLVYLGISTVLQTQDDFRLVIPYVEFSKQLRGTRPLVLDSSSLIDARIAELATTGLIQAPLVIPRFVVDELQQLADSRDKLKRARGRRGLDVVGRLQRTVADVVVDDVEVPGTGVDAKLVELARRNHGSIVTTDFGLQRVAQIQSVGAISLHEVASSLRPSVFPGDRLDLRLVKSGEQEGQGVGYLEDGTMVVVEGGQSRVGAGPVRVEIGSSLQTAAGRLIFATLVEEDGRVPPGLEKRPAGPRSEPPAADASASTDAGPAHEAGPPDEPAADDSANGQSASPHATDAKAGPFPARRVQRRQGNARNPRR